jgi:hypothetical protein
MATITDYRRLRSDIGATEAAFSDVDAANIFEEAGESYTDVSSITAATRVIALRRLLASSAKLTTYQANASMERLSDVFGHLERLLAHWNGELDKATKQASGTGAARFGKTGARPSRIKEYPNGG